MTPHCLFKFDRKSRSRDQKSDPCYLHFVLADLIGTSSEDRLDHRVPSFIQ
jgi:hypothetical protein